MQASPPPKHIHNPPAPALDPEDVDALVKRLHQHGARRRPRGRARRQRREHDDAEVSEVAAPQREGGQCGLDVGGVGGGAGLADERLGGGGWKARGAVSATPGGRGAGEASAGGVAGRLRSPPAQEKEKAPRAARRTVSAPSSCSVLSPGFIAGSTTSRTCEGAGRGGGRWVCESLAAARASAMRGRRAAARAGSPPLAPRAPRRSCRWHRGG